MNELERVIMPAHGSPRVGSGLGSPQHSSRGESTDQESRAVVRRGTLSRSSQGGSGGRVEEYRDRRLFEYSKDILLRKQDDEVLKQFELAIASANRFKGELSKIAGFLHQRKAQIGSIRKDHLSWKEELEKHDDKQSWTAARSHYDDIPLLQDSRKMALAFAYMTKLEAMTHPLREKYDELVSVLKSPLHHEALEFYKQKKKECKELIKKKSAVERVEGLFSIFRDVAIRICATKPEIPGKEICIVRETVLLYQELLKFVAYTVSKIHPNTKQQANRVASSDSDSTNDQSLTAQVTSISGSISQLSLTDSADAVPVGPAAGRAQTVTPTLTKYSQPGYALVWSTPEASKESEEDPLAEMRYGTSGYDEPAVGRPSTAAQLPPAVASGWSMLPTWSSVTNLFGSSAVSSVQQLAQEVPDSADEVDKALRQIDELLASISQQEQELAKLIPRRQRRKVSQETEVKVRAYIQNSSSVDLHKEDRFRNGQMVTTERVIGPYNGIRDQVEALESIAKALAKLLTVLEHRIADLCEGKQAPLEGYHSLDDEKRSYKALIRGLEQFIQEEQQKLIELPISDRVHAGWYYAAKLLSNVREVKKVFNQFTELSQDDFSLYGGAINWLIDYLDPRDLRLAGNPHYFTGAVAITRLYASIQSVCQLTKPASSESFGDKFRAMIYDTIEQIIAKKGLCTLELSAKEKEVPALVLGKLPLETLREAIKGEQEILPAAVRKYLMKGFLRHLYFSNKRVDPEFELVLDMLKNSVYYSYAFTATVRQKMDFARYHAAYMLQTDMNRYAASIRLMSESWSLLCENVQGTALDNLFRYTAARQKLSNVRAALTSAQSPAQAARVEFVQAKTGVIFRQMEASYPVYFAQLESIDTPSDVRRPLDQGIYKLVAISLYSDNSKESRQAANELTMILGALSVEDLPEDEWLGNLLAGWYFERFVAGLSDGIAHRDFMLTKILSRYLADRSTRALWNSWYGIGFMEIALAKLATLREEARGGPFAKIGVALSTTRQPEHYELWKRIVSTYEQFRALFISSGDLVLGNPTHQKADKLLQSVVDLFDFVPIDGPQDEENTYLSVARWCYHDMRRQFNLRYVLK